MPVVKYNDNDGFVWLVVVPPGTEQDQYEFGVVVGPPDLRSLGLTKNELKRLHVALVYNNLVNAKQVKGSTGKLYSLVKATFPKRDTNDLVRKIKSLMQYDFYKEN